MHTVHSVVSVVVVCVCVLGRGAAGFEDIFNSSLSVASLQKYCERDDFTARCPPGEVIIMQHAQYGRMSEGPCVSREYGHLGCHADVLPVLDSLCSGRQQCSFPVTDLQGVATSDCPSELLSYLEASYSCLPVTPCQQSTCAGSDYIRIRNTQGYLSSAVSSQTGCGSARCPWLLEALPGQKINITAYYFSSQPHQTLEQKQLHLNTPRLCHRFGTISDNGMQKDLISCEHRPRAVESHISQSHRVEVRVNTEIQGQQTGQGSQGGDAGAEGEEVNYVQFVIKYEVFGCPTVLAPKHGYIALQSDNLVLVRCNNSDDEWRLQCLGDTWSTDVSSCPAGSHWQWQGGDGGTASPHGMLIIIAIGIALGIAAGFLMLGLAVIYFKRRHMLTRIPVPTHDIVDPEKLMPANYPPSAAGYPHDDKLSDRKQSTGNGTVTRPYVQHPVIPEYNAHPGDQAYPQPPTSPQGVGDGGKPCAYIYQGNSYGGYTMAQHVYESPTFDRKVPGMQLNAAEFAQQRNPQNIGNV